MDATVLDLKRCAQEGCDVVATVRVVWPGRGWLYYCEPHGSRAEAMLAFLGSVTVSERDPIGWV